MRSRIKHYVICFALAFLLISIVSGYTQTPAKTAARNHVDTVKNIQPSSVQTVTTPSSETQVLVPWMDYFKKIFLAAGIIFLAFLIIKYVSRFLIWLSEKTHILQIATRQAVIISKMVIWTLLIYLIFEIVLSPPAETIIILLASAGLAISLAFQDLFKNILNGITILFDRPFQIGDKIRIGTTYGEVLTIGLRRIRILTPDETIITLPSGEITRQAIIHLNADSSHSTVRVELFLPPETDMVEVKQIAQRAAEVSRYIYLLKPIQIFFSNELQQGRPVLKLQVKACVLHIRYELLFSSEVTEVIFQELLRRGLLKTDTLTNQSKI